VDSLLAAIPTGEKTTVYASELATIGYGENYEYTFTNYVETENYYYKGYILQRGVGKYILEITGYPTAIPVLANTDIEIEIYNNILLVTLFNDTIVTKKEIIDYELTNGDTIKVKCTTDNAGGGSNILLFHNFHKTPYQT
jgi:hypothetical protein